MQQIQKLDISIHALRVEGDSNAVVYRMLRNEFLSTPSGWRATSRAPSVDFWDLYFYPRPPGGGRLFMLCTFLLFIYLISIHALRVEGDISAEGLEQGRRISIHALRVEGDR